MRQSSRRRVDSNTNNEEGNDADEEKRPLSSLSNRNQLTQNVVEDASRSSRRISSKTIPDSQSNTNSTNKKLVDLEHDIGDKDQENDDGDDDDEEKEDDRLWVQCNDCDKWR